MRLCWELTAIDPSSKTRTDGLRVERVFLPLSLVLAFVIIRTMSGSLRRSRCVADEEGKEILRTICQNNYNVHSTQLDKKTRRLQR